MSTVDEHKYIGRYASCREIFPAVRSDAHAFRLPKKRTKSVLYYLICAPGLRCSLRNRTRFMRIIWHILSWYSDLITITSCGVQTMTDCSSECTLKRWVTCSAHCCTRWLEDRRAYPCCYTHKYCNILKLRHIISLPPPIGKQYVQIIIFM